MYYYNVTIKVTPEIEKDWLQWMWNEHLDAVVGTGCFDRYEFFQLIEPVDEGEVGSTYVAQYQTDTAERYERYIRDYAPALRDRGFQLFGNQFIAFRSVLKKMSSL